MKEINVKDIPVKPSRTSDKYKELIERLLKLEPAKALFVEPEKDFEVKAETVKAVFYRLQKAKTLPENMKLEERSGKLYFSKE